MPASRVVGPAGELVLGKVAGMPVAGMQGRVHLYEGHDPEDVVILRRSSAAIEAEAISREKYPADASRGRARPPRAE